MCNWSEYRLRQGREMGIQEGEKRGIEETIKVITLMHQGKNAEEISKQVSLSHAEVKGIIAKIHHHL